MNWMDYDTEKSIKSYEYTKQAVYQMECIIDSEEFKEMSAEMIFDFLKSEINIVIFKDYLKRYLYEAIGFDEPFSEIPDEEYMEIMRYSFDEKHAPYSFEPTTRKKSAIIKGFMNTVSTKRDTVFVLGFGLQMSAEDVNDFLVKVLLESPFDFNNPVETIYWFCYKKGLPYSRAKSLMDYYENLPVDPSLSEKRWNDIRSTPTLFILNEEQLKMYLKHQKRFSNQKEREEALYETYLEIYGRCQQAIANYENTYDMKNRQLTAENVGPADIERYLCNGIPITKSGNMQKMSSSLLTEQFRNKRISRQKINNTLKKKFPVERFDLISLLFLYYALEEEGRYPKARYIDYINEINDLLIPHGMMGIYPTNPYEAFILMCLISEDPLTVYADIVEMSYESNE